ncbi:MAG: choice-of-anchor L domain-containing protein [Bacteroidetes bacterium]|nr:choice-of-anchor L domain-containing protein [Bacteroidota bacterium]
MKKFSPLFFLLTGTFFFHTADAQLTVNNGMTPQQLVQNVLLGTGVTVSNISFTGAPLAIGTFNGTSSNIGLANGILMTTGWISLAPGPNIGGGTGNDNGLPGDPLLSMLSQDSTYDAAILEFDFIPYADTIRFRYVFASEEYNEYVCADVNDVFGFFISGPGITGQQNLALIPGTSMPVSINTLNNGSVGANGSAGPGCILSNAGYYIDNTNGTTVEYDGFTTVLTAQTIVTPCLTYHIRLAIADGGDHVFDSGVFLEAGSFISGNPIMAVASATSGTLGCAPFTATFSNTSTGTNHFYWNFGDGTAFDTTSNPAHTYFQGGIYNVQLIADDTSACDFSDTAYFTIVIDSGLIAPSFDLTSTGYCDSIRADVTSTSTGAHLYAWNFGDGTTATGTSASHVYTSPGVYQLYHIVTDTICHISDSVSQQVVTQPRLISFISSVGAEGCTPLHLDLCYPGSATAATQFHWNFGNGISSSRQCDTITYPQAGTFDVRLVVTDSSYCNFSDTSDISVRVKATPEASFDYSVSPSIIHPVLFSNTSVHAQTYEWNFGDGENAYIKNPDHQYLQPGMYTVCLRANNDACLDTVCQELKVVENPQAIWFPDAFTPNGDGINDVFSVSGIGIVTVQTIVYNRWGERVFESYSLDQSWDGMFKGRYVENGVYIMHVKAQLLDGEEVDKQGTVTIYK